MITVALVGANGMLAKMVREKAPANCSLHLLDLPDFDMTDAGQVRKAFDGIRPAIILNCAAFTAVDACETQEEQATRVNADGVAILAAAALDLDAVLVHISTDYVFPGTLARPYREDDPVGPLSAYGRSKLKGEQAILASGLEKYFIIRTSWLYGPYGNNFVETILRLAKEREELAIVADQIGSPTYTGDLAEAIFTLLGLPVSGHRSPITGHLPFGIYHFANEGGCSWYDFALAIVEEGRSHGLPIKVTAIKPIATEEYPLPAKRPANSVFDKSKFRQTAGTEIPGWRDGLHRYFAVREKNPLR